MINTFILFVLLLLPSVTQAQIPTVCSDSASLRDSICCPSTTQGVCGSSSGRGQCVTLSLPDYNPSSSDVRENWPHYYTQVCSCNQNYGGVDCNRCKFGYFGSDCSQMQVLLRREAGTYTDSEWDEFSRVLKLARVYDSGYKVVLKEELPGTENLDTTNISLYGMYVWAHHYAAKDSLDMSIFPPRDYAHAAPGFTTWHRHHTLWLEWEIQWMLEGMGESDYHNFRFPFGTGVQRYNIVLVSDPMTCLQRTEWAPLITTMVSPRKRFYRGRWLGHNLLAQPLHPLRPS